MVGMTNNCMTLSCFPDHTSIVGISLVSSLINILTRLSKVYNKIPSQTTPNTDKSPYHLCEWFCKNIAGLKSHLRVHGCSTSIWRDGKLLSRSSNHHIYMCVCVCTLKTYYILLLLAVWWKLHVVWYFGNNTLLQICIQLYFKRAFFLNDKNRLQQNLT